MKITNDDELNRAAYVQIDLALIQEKVLKFTRNDWSFKTCTDY